VDRHLTRTGNSNLRHPHPVGSANSKCINWLTSEIQSIAPGRRRQYPRPSTPAFCGCLKRSEGIKARYFLTTAIPVNGFFVPPGIEYSTSTGVENPPPGRNREFQACALGGVCNPHRWCPPHFLPYGSLPLGTACGVNFGVITRRHHCRCFHIRPHCQEPCQLSYSKNNTDSVAHADCEGSLLV